MTWSNGKVKTITAPNNEVYTYNYGFGGYLSSVVYPDNLGTRTYHYEDNLHPGALTGISNNGVRYSNYSYRGDGRASVSGLVGGVDQSSFTYGSDYTDVTNALGQTTRYQIAQVDGSSRVIGVERPASTVCPAGAHYTAYVADGNADYELDAYGFKTDYSYDADGRLTQKITGIGPNGETDQRQITQFVWDPVFTTRLLTIKVFGTSLSAPISETRYAYYPAGDARARLLSAVTVVNKSGVGVTNSARTTGYNYTLHSNGLVKTMLVDGPVAGSADLLTFTYDTAGNLTSVKNSLGHTTSYANYNGLGQPGRVTNANGGVVDYTYNARGSVLTVKNWVNGVAATTSNVYDAQGRLTRTTMPDGDHRTYFYDAVGQLKRIERLDSHVVTQGPGGEETRDTTSRALFQRDLLGNITREESHRLIEWRGWDPIRNRPIGSMTTEQKVVSYTDYDEGGRIKALRGNDGQNRRYKYNANGDLRTITDSLGRVTTLSRDRHGRVLTSSNAAGTTTFGYNPVGLLTSVRDPRGKTTTYTYDGFGQLWATSSPDTGISRFEYNAAGQRTRMTRADGGITTYSYDGLGRPTGITAGGSTRTFTYDACTGGKGLLCSSSYYKGRIDYTYTPQGQVRTQNQKIGTSTIAFNQAFSWDGSGRLVGMSYPGGLSIGYGYSKGDPSVMTVTFGGVTRTVVSSLARRPFGAGPTTLRYGNGLTRYYPRDSDGRLTSLSVVDGATPKQQLTYGYDANDNIINIANGIQSGLSQSYSYDALGRLTHLGISGPDQGFAYDANR